MLSKLRKYVYDLYDNISYRGVNDQQSNTDRDLTILLNRYFILCSIFFLIHGISNILYFRYFAWDSIALFVFSFLTIVLNRIVIGSKFLKPLLTAIIFMLAVIITYYSSYCGLNSGIFLYFFPLITVFPLFFDFKTDKLFIIFLLLCILIEMYTSAIFDFKLIKKNPHIGNYDHILLILNIFFILLIFP